MLTTTSVIKALIEENLELSQIWNKNLLNLTALAKELKPEIEKMLDLKVELSSLVVSLNRLSKTWQVDEKIPKISIKNIQIIKNITTLVYKKNTTAANTLMKLKNKIAEYEDVFFTYEVDQKNIIFSSESEYLSPYLKDLNGFETYKKSENNELIAVFFELESTFNSAPNNQFKTESFIHYAVLQKLAESNIPVVRMRSCQNQFLFLIENKYLDSIYKFWND